MKKTIAVLSILFFVLTPILAQEPQIIWSKDLDPKLLSLGKVGSEIPILIKDKLYVVNKRYNSDGRNGVFSIASFDRNLNFLKQSLITNQWDIQNKHQEVEATKILGFDNGLSLYNGFTKFGGWGEAKAFTINPENKELVAENIQSVEKKQNIKALTIIISNDKSRIAYLGIVKKAPKNSIGANHVTVIDEKAAIVWNDSLGIMADEESSSVEQFITNNGDLVFLSHQDTKYFIYSYEWKTKQVKSLLINDKENKYTTKPLIQIDDRGQIEILQFAADTTHAPVIAGYVYTICDIHLQELQKNYIALNTGSLQVENIKANASKKSMYNYTAKHIFHTSSGKTLILFERGVNIYDKKNARRDIIIACEKQNKLEWNSAITRNIMAGNSYENYLCKLKGEDLYFLYNDEFENLKTNTGSELRLLDEVGIDLHVNKVTIIIMNPVMVLVHIDKQGQLTKKEITGPNDKKKWMIYTSSGHNFDNDNWIEDQNTLYFVVNNPFGGNQSNTHIGKIEFN
jgi:hypothetical protein